MFSIFGKFILKRGNQYTMFKESKELSTMQYHFERLFSANKSQIIDFRFIGNSLDFKMNSNNYFYETIKNYCNENIERVGKFLNALKVDLISVIYAEFNTLYKKFEYGVVEIKEDQITLERILNPLIEVKGKSFFDNCEDDFTHEDVENIVKFFLDHKLILDLGHKVRKSSEEELRWI